VAASIRNFHVGSRLQVSIHSVVRQKYATEQSKNEIKEHQAWSQKQTLAPFKSCNQSCDMSVEAMNGVEWGWIIH
jgi:hypothetical protein